MEKIKKVKKGVDKICNQNLSFDEVLYKKAMGYVTEDIVEEYAIQDNEEILIKKKVNKKQYPPDLSALQTLIEKQKNEVSYSSMSIEELEKEYSRIENIVKNEIKEELKNGN